MDLMLIRALLTIAKYCAQREDCKKCAIHEFCGKQPLQW